MTETPSESPPILHCAYHPNVETTLRCNKCGKPICAKCAILTPIGYRCKDCVRNQQKVFETARLQDYIITFILITILSYLGSIFVTFIGFFTILLAPVAGTLFAEVTHRVTKHRRSKRLFQLAALSAFIGSLPPLLFIIFGLFNGFNSFAALFPLLWSGLYTFTVTTTTYYRLGGIQIR